MEYRRLGDFDAVPGLIRKLAQLPRPPKVLFVSGCTDGDFPDRYAAVVGSRRMTGYGRQAIESIVPQLVSEGFAVVSGFMYGADQYAHEVCLDCGGRTAAVLGWGISRTLTGRDAVLAERIIACGGFLLSEWEQRNPAPWTFPARNRIVAALADEAVVIEAAEKSGSLITARLVAGMGKPLFAVPGPITSAVSRGTNALIADGKAVMWTNVRTAVPVPSDDPLVDLLAREPLTADEIARILNTPVSTIGARISMLVLSGTIAEDGGKFRIS